MASQDETPQQHPTPGGSAKPEQDRADRGAADGHGLSDASETIVSGDHAAGTAKPDDGAAAGSAPAAGSAAAQPEDDIDHDDWDAAFADAAGTSSGAGRQGGTTSVNEAAVVPGGHPSLAQRSTLPMRRASTMPNVSEYSDLSEDEQQRAGHIDAAVPASATAGKDAAADSDNTTAAEPDKGANADGLDKNSKADGLDRDAEPKPARHEAPVTSGASLASASGVTTASAASGTTSVESAASDSAAAPQTTPISTDAASASHSAGNPDADEPADREAGDEVSEEEIRRRAEERERAGTAKPVLARILQVMIAVFFPVMLLAAAIRAVATPLFLWVEYHRPGFPADTYGFSTDDRMTYGSYAVDYLLNFSGARYLGDLVTPSGESLYLDSEVSHMADVKTVLTIAFVVGLAMAVLSLLACIYLAKRSPGGIRRALFAGSVVTLVLVGALIVMAVLGWENFFTQVHSLFFANGNWTFRLDDTLIRLFPAQFWMDAGIVIASLVLLVCIVVLVASWPTKARRERSRLKQEQARRRYLDSLEAV